MKYFNYIKRRPHFSGLTQEAKGAHKFYRGPRTYHKWQKPSFRRNKFNPKKRLSRSSYTKLRRFKANKNKVNYGLSPRNTTQFLMEHSPFETNEEPGDWIFEGTMIKDENGQLELKSLDSKEELLIYPNESFVQEEDESTLKTSWVWSLLAFVSGEAVRKVELD